MAGDVNYYPHHIGDYLRDTAHLSALEDGTYRRLLDLYYASEKPLVLDFIWLCKLVRAREDSEREAVHEILRQFFEKTPEGWRNKRADLEIRLSYQRAKVARQNGKLGGRPKTQRVISGLAKPNPPGLAKHNPDESSQYQYQNQIPKPKNKNIGRKRPCVPLPESFSISERVKTWASEKGFDRLEAHFEYFVGVAKAKGYAYADWDQALMNAISKDWAGLRKNDAPDYSAVIRQIEEEEIARAKH